MRFFSFLLLSGVVCLSPMYGFSRGRNVHKVRSQRVQYGVASWYGGHDQGRMMASGRPFNEYSMVAAHRTLPLGTRVRVTDLRNGRSVVVRIMDRGPNVGGRVIDLSKEAAMRLGFVRRGLAPVRIRTVSTPKRPVRGSGELLAFNRVER